MPPTPLPVEVSPPATHPADADPRLVGTPLAERLARGDVFADQCPSRQILQHVTSRWGVLVLVALSPGTLRFSELRRRIQGVSERMLAQTLQWLEADGFVRRHAHRVVPPHVDYCLTPAGEAVAQRVAALADWIELNLADILAAQARHESRAQSASAPDQPPGAVRRHRL